MLLLVPSDPLSGRRADAHFAAEAAAAREAGMDVALIDHDALVAGRLDDVVRRVPPDVEAVYRGWMVTSAQYAQLAALLSVRDVRLRTAPQQYQQAHELPGWFSHLRALSPAAAWTDGPDLDAFERCCAEVGPGPAVLRDYVKSLKHSWHEAAYIPDTSDVVAARAVARRFHELREEHFTGGFVVRRFEHFVSAEVRTWWVGGRCRLTTAHPDTPDESPPTLDLSASESVVVALGLPFVTVDLAQRDDGEWRVIELGDGQVSDRPSTTSAAELVAAIHAVA